VPRPPPDVVIVLGAATTQTGGPSATLRRRVAKGIEIFETSGAEKLLMTGGPAGKRPAEAEVMRDLALGAGVPAHRILIETASSTTFESARRTADIMESRGWSRAIVVSDAIHIPRSLLAFRAVGVRAAGRGAPVVWRVGRFRTPFHYMGYELAGIALYATRIIFRRLPD
jgi:uncharacterized SAM-binding protein YcdF (DUF218 family)